MTVSLSREVFESCLNKKFKATFSKDLTYDLVLVNIKVSKKIESLDIEPYSLLFRAERSQEIFNQGLVQLWSEVTGDISLFLIPRLPDNDWIFYEAIIS